jgi:hypothetical protein
MLNNRRKSFKWSQKAKRPLADAARLFGSSAFIHRQFADFSAQRSNLSQCYNRQNIGRY